MEVKEILKEPIILKHSDTVSHAVSALVSGSNPEAIVFKNKTLLGILLSRDLVKKRVDNPSGVRIESFVTRIDSFPSSIDRETLKNTMLVNDYKAVPIVDGDRIMIATKRELLMLFLKESVLKKTKAEEIMNFPYCVSSDDNIATARSIFRDLNVAAVPVVEEKNNVLGLVSSIDLLKSITEKKRPMRGEVSGESFSSDSVNVSAVMSLDIPRIAHDSDLRAVSEIIIKKNAKAVVVEKEGRMIGVITPRDILKVLGRDVSGVYVSVTGADKEDPFIRGVMDSEIESLVKKISKMVVIESFIVNIDKHKTNGRSRYDVRARLITRKGLFFGDSQEWDVTKALKGTLSKIEREFIKKKEKAGF